MVYLGSAKCPFANDKALLSLIERVKVALQQRSNQHGTTFSAIGVAVDWRIADGIRHLDKFGSFDEVMTGRKWYGIGARLYFREMLPGQAATPQVLVFIRNVSPPNLQYPETTYRVSDETMLVRKVGLENIDKWLERGLPLPLDLLEL